LRAGIGQHRGRDRGAQLGEPPEHEGGGVHGTGQLDLAHRPAGDRKRRPACGGHPGVAAIPVRRRHDPHPQGGAVTGRQPPGQQRPGQQSHIAGVAGYRPCAARLVAASGLPMDERARQGG
jgi:hypothetical protein